LFGASTPLAKPLLGPVDPWMLAGLLYLGSGVGLFLFREARRLRRSSGPRADALTGSGWAYLGAAILAGGVAAPVLLMQGLARTPASSASLLLNLEAVFTILLAWLALGEPLDRRVAAGMAAIVAGATAISWQGEAPFTGALGPAAVVGACAAWAIDNNLTQRVSLHDPTQIAAAKGVSAGAVNVGLALLLGAEFPSTGAVVAACLIGLFGYGLSLVFFVLALRHLGAARTAAYFATAPFAGAAMAVVGLGEPAGWGLGAAGLLMAAGTWLTLTERHEHEHEHAPMEHAHLHRHDEHHRHQHAPSDPPGEPHAHRHAHARLRHSHPHHPDVHHRHPH
jgi:drug/metabolite transporter (DMT)-like permease